MAVWPFISNLAVLLHSIFDLHAFRILMQVQGLIKEFFFAWLNLILLWAWMDFAAFTNFAVFSDNILLLWSIDTLSAILCICKGRFSAGAAILSKILVTLWNMVRLEGWEN